MFDEKKSKIDPIEKLQNVFPGMMVTRLKFIYEKLDRDLEKTMNFLEDKFSSLKVCSVDKKTPQQKNKSKVKSSQNFSLNPYFGQSCFRFQNLSEKELKNEFLNLRANVFRYQKVLQISKKVILRHPKSNSVV